MNRKGFTLVEIMIVVAIIALLAAIAIPNLLRARLNANEAAAQSTLKTVSTACESYRAAQTLPSYDPSATGANMTGATPPYLDVGIFAAAGRQGYLFVYSPQAAVGGIIQQYVASAEPVTDNVTGARVFAINETGVLRAAVVGTAAPTTTAAYQAAAFVVVQ
ncbi:MAG: prepilin-type N-terminal cleavage/methylation domain-containing protein [Candidatus Omnitrophota bacterium]